MNAVRQPAVAGMFYPAGAAQLRADVETLLGAPAQDSPVPKALIVPHAGYVYSGATAAAAYRLLGPVRSSIRRVVLFGPAHRVYLDGLAAPAVDAFRTPLGDVPIDRAAIDDIAGLAGVQISDLAHQDEHSLEVQLPFLQVALEDFALVPLVVGRAGADQVAAVMDALWNGPETLVVVSSDLSHYHEYDSACELDARTCSRILARASDLHGDEACGAYAVNGLMRASRSSLLDIELVDCRNSGDTAGSRDRVVGYGSFSLH